MSAAVVVASVPAQAVKRSLPMRVTVHVGGERHRYDGVFASAVDAVEDALERFSEAGRIEVEPLRKGAVR